MFGAVVSFHLAYEVPALAPLALVFFVCVLQLSRSASKRLTIYSGWLVGLGLYGPQLFFFWSIFHQAAIILWLVLASWFTLYLLLEQFALQRLGPVWGTLTAPVWWLAVEYFRSELYALRFSWLNLGYVFPMLSGWLGMYGAGFFLMLVAAFCTLAWSRRGWRPVAVIGLCLFLLLSGFTVFHSGGSNLTIAGVQFEEGSSLAILKALENLSTKHPEASVFVLSEYSFGETIPAEIKAWCARRQRWLVAGGKQYIDSQKSRYHNTAFVIGPEGTEIFQQGKSRPIQFFDDGLPAERQAVWNSPWGKIGLCICYDLSYTRVTDSLVRQGACLIIVPTMDVEGWGRHEHLLHARVAPTRAAEYGVPIFRLCSSGISQAVGANGRVSATAPFPGQGETLVGSFDLAAGRGHLPVDRFIVWPCLVAAALLLADRLLAALQARFFAPAPAAARTLTTRAGGA